MKFTGKVWNEQFNGHRGDASVYDWRIINSRLGFQSKSRQAQSGANDDAGIRGAGRNDKALCGILVTQILRSYNGLDLIKYSFDNFERP